MDKDRTDLIVRLCTQAGMIMEDASVLALTVTGQNEAAMSGAITILGREVAAMAALIAAAEVMTVRS